jgi:farnesyl diphosphate synthase
MGAVIVGLEKIKQESLYAFGIDLGLLFQIQDDIIDETHSEEEAGKTTGNDGDKNSFVNLIGLEKTIEEAETLARHLEEQFTTFDRVLQDGLGEIVQKYLYRHR